MTTVLPFNGTVGSDGSLTIPDLVPGNYSVTISAAGYVSKTVSVTVTSGTTAPVDGSLEAQPGSISITSAPVGATITITSI